MEENVKYGFFDQIPIAFFHPSEYKKILPLKKICLIGFILLIPALIVVLEYIIPFGAWDVSVGGLENLVTNGIPAFSLDHGVMNMESPMDIVLSNAIHVKVDTDEETYSEEDLDDQYVEEFLISKNNMIFNHSGMTYEVVFSELNYTINNQGLAELLPMIKISIGITFFLMYLLKIGGYLVSALFFALLCRSGVHDGAGRRVTLGIAFVFAVYARALFALLASVNVCLGYLISDTLVLVVGAFFTIRYIFSAEREYLGVEKKKGMGL